MSDLHLEFGKMSKDDFEPADVLILAGDIDVWGREGTKMFEWMETLPFPYIIFTPGLVIITLSVECVFTQSYMTIVFQYVQIP